MGAGHPTARRRCPAGCPASHIRPLLASSCTSFARGSMSAGRSCGRRRMTPREEGFVSGPRGRAAVASGPRGRVGGSGVGSPVLHPPVPARARRRPRPGHAGRPATGARCPRQQPGRRMGITVRLRWPHLLFCHIGPCRPDPAPVAAGEGSVPLCMSWCDRYSRDRFYPSGCAVQASTVLRTSSGTGTGSTGTALGRTSPPGPLSGRRGGAAPPIRSRAVTERGQRLRFGPAP
jgi:hypothetical protein